MKSYDCAMPAFYEGELYKMAMGKKKTVGALEKMEEQLTYFNKAMPDEYVLAQIRSSDDGKAEMSRMLNNYKQENLNGVYEDIAFSKSMDANALYWILHFRNSNWAERMPEMMKKESNFFAVGSGHLGGEKGVIQLLQAKGYQVKPIMN